MKFTLRDASLCSCDNKYVKLLKDNGFKLTEQEEELPEEAIECGLEPDITIIVEIETLEDLKKLIEVVGNAIVINMYGDDILIYDDYLE